MKGEIHIHSRTDELLQHAAERFVELAGEAVATRGVCHIALAGGSTPRGLYQRLAAPAQAERLPWDKLHFWFGDERCVPPDDAQSNYRMADEALLSQVPVPPANIHRIHGETAPREAAAQYAAEVQQWLPEEAGGPRFDLILLGMGPDGHVASLFPDTEILHKRKPTVASVFVDKLDAWRVSLTLPTLNGARHIILLVNGEKKADIVRHVLRDVPGARPLPVQLLRPKGDLEWFLDAAAARHLGPEPPA